MRPAALLALLAAAAIAAGAWAVRQFPTAFPLVTLDLRMDRARALADAEALRVRDGLGPPEAPRNAVRFDRDLDAQTFIELEGGGRARYQALMARDLYQPFQWNVRFFRPGDPREATLRFAPDGRPYGFVEKLPEAAPGPALAADSARRLATAALGRWGVDTAPYTLVESGRELRPSGRADHTFTWERGDAEIGAGTLRVRAVVSGDRVTEVTRFVRVPEAFARRYQQMRALNDGIATGASFVILVLYGLVGLGGGLLWLLRRRALLWPPALRWGLAIGTANGLAYLAQWPLLWSGYDTAVDAGTFATQQGLIAAAMAVGMGMLLAVSFAVAEGLTRAAFPARTQLWRLWARDVAPAPEVGAHTLVGYLLVPLFFAYVVAFYAVATRVLGWWSPADTLINPDVLASWVPWLSALAPSLQAGFWEECLFRAVPLAGAALLGERFGRRGAWLAGAMVVQALVFGAGHANYPAQPGYARVVELIVPSLLFGWIYLRLGLLAGIVMHFVYDVVWFALPLFTLDAPGVGLQRALLVGGALVPVLMLALRRAQAGAVPAVPDDARNGAWAPPAAGEEAPVPAPAAP
ncbi:MAG: type II CAAX endopeptidase family protein, partial [Gemmatimonadales bacterium]|nr:type II CAAX endopeptidase family protein [Gemmatimonadales bacterium]